MRKSSKEKYANQARRQSPRLRSGSALFEEDDGRNIGLCSRQRHSTNNHTIKHLNFDMQEPDVDVCKPSEHINAVSDSDSDELTIIDITLKDLQQKCKDKRRNGLKTAASSSDHPSHSDSEPSPVRQGHVKVKEEEPDLEEPLIILKRKITKEATRKRESRKRACLDPLVAENDDSCLFTSSDCSLKESFPPIMTETVSTYNVVSEHDAQVRELKNVQGQNLMETVNSVVCSMAAKRKPSSDFTELSYDMESEIVEAYSLKQHAKDNCMVGLSLGINDDGRFVGNSLPEQIQEVSRDWPERQQKPFISFDNSDNCLSAMKEASILSVSQLKNGIRVDDDFTNTVKRELDEISPQEYASPNVDSAKGFIEKLCHSEEAMTDLHHSANRDLLVNEELSFSRSTIPFYCVECTDHEELNKSLPAVDVDALEIKKVALAMSREESSQVAASISDTLYHNSVSETAICPDADKCGSSEVHGIPLEESMRENRMNDMEPLGESSYKRMTSEHSCTLNMISNGFQDSTDDMTLQGVTICSPGRERNNNCNLPCEKVYGLEEIFLSSNDKLNGAAEIVTCCSNEFSSFTDALRMRDKPEVQPSTVSSSCVIIPNDEQCSGSDLVKSTEKSCPFPEEKLNNTLDQLLCNENLYLLNSLGKRQAESDQSLTECCSPKKLLSNRQTISPSSQEKLCWALNDMYAHNGSQISGQNEAGYLLSPKKVNKKRRNDSEILLSPVKKVNLKSPNISYRLPCSCSKSSSLTMHMEKAIVFSQRQMHDIERLATQLLSGLSLMRNIMEGTLRSDVHHFVSSNFTTDEIRAANENALELERTTKKWLTIMTKDCNRFCKIMKVADNKSAVPVTGACKQKRKITFADEVGGVLCQVKVFERQQSPVTTLESQQDS